MRKFRVIGALVALFLLGVSTWGQSRPIAPPSKPVKNYDRFDDSTLYTLPFFEVGTPIFKFGVLAKSEGKSKPKEVLIGFHLIYVGEAPEGRLNFIADQKRMKFSTPTTRRDGNFVMDSRQTFLWYVVPVEEFNSFSLAKTIEGRLDSTEFKFDEKQMDVIREFQKLLGT